MGPGGTLRMVFEADAWDSTISFAPGIPVTLGGTLELTFADDVNLASQVGRTFDLFDWTGVNPTGAFAVSSPYAWDLSNLYTTGEVTLTAVPEPSGFFLLSLALAAILATRRAKFLHPGRVVQIATAIFPLVAVRCHAGRHLSVGVHQPGRPQSFQAAKHRACSGWRGRRCRTEHQFIRPQPDTWPTCFAQDLTEADLSQSNLTNANFLAAILTDADFTNAAVKGATFDKNYHRSFGADLLGTGITPAQLYSTASYQERDLRGIGLSENNLAGTSFAGQNLSGANFAGAILTDADFTDSEISATTFQQEACYACPRGTGITPTQLYATASYKKRELSGVGFSYNDFSGGNFAGQNLTNANFYGARLTDADFTGAECAARFGVNDTCLPVYGCDVASTGLSLGQLYSTASYQARDLSGIDLHRNRLSGGDFTGQNLSNADFSGAELTNADFAGTDVPELAWAEQDLLMRVAFSLRSSIRQRAIKLMT